MYAGHFAAGLAIKAREPRAPLPALMGLIFLPDLLWLGLSISGVELVEPGVWFDGWSHSFVSIIVQSLIAAALFWRQGRGVALAAGGAVLSHLFLDLPMHPAKLDWYPHSAARFGNLLHGWAGKGDLLGKANGWWVESAVVAAGLAIYVANSRRIGVGNAAAWAGVILVGSLQLAFG